jgi:hypothetical protein
MALNLNKVGRPIAKIEGGKYDKKVLSIYTENHEDDFNRFNNLKIDGKFQQVPDPEKEREILYITGPSGSGKSTYSCNYINNWKKLKKNKEGEVYLFSALNEDTSLEPVSPLRINIGENLLSNPLTCEDFQDSLVIFDDIDVISDKKLREEVYKILNQILETGRHFNVSCVITNHLPTAGKDTRRVLNECHTITYFPHSGAGRGLKYLLNEYLGLDKRTQSKIKKSKSRWATIFKNYPNVAMTEKNVFLTSEESDED